MIIMMKLIDLYFYIGTMWRHNYPSMFYGALLFHVPAFAIIGIIAHFFRKVFSIVLPGPCGLVFMSVFVLIVYLYYKRSGRGAKVIRLYRQTNIGKWYVVLPLGITYFVAFILITICIIKIIDYFAT